MGCLMMPNILTKPIPEFVFKAGHTIQIVIDEYFETQENLPLSYKIQDCPEFLMFESNCLTGIAPVIR